MAQSRTVRVTLEALSGKTQAWIWVVSYQSIPSKATPRGPMQKAFPTAELAEKFKARRDELFPDNGMTVIKAMLMDLR